MKKRYPKYLSSLFGTPKKKKSVDDRLGIKSDIPLTIPDDISNDIKNYNDRPILSPQPPSMVGLFMNSLPRLKNQPQEIQEFWISPPINFKPTDNSLSAPEISNNENGQGNIENFIPSQNFSPPQNLSPQFFSSPAQNFIPAQMFSSPPQFFSSPQQNFSTYQTSFSGPIPPQFYSPPPIINHADFYASPFFLSPQYYQPNIIYSPNTINPREFEESSDIKSDTDYKFDFTDAGLVCGTLESPLSFHNSEESDTDDSVPDIFPDDFPYWLTKDYLYYLLYRKKQYVPSLKVLACFALYNDNVETYNEAKNYISNPNIISGYYNCLYLKQLNQLIYNNINLTWLFSPILSPGEYNSSDSRMFGNPFHSYSCCDKPSQFMLQIKLEQLPKNIRQLTKKSGMILIFRCLECARFYSKYTTKKISQATTDKIKTNKVKPLDLTTWTLALYADQLDLSGICSKWRNKILNLLSHDIHNLICGNLINISNLANEKNISNDFQTKCSKCYNLTTPWLKIPTKNKSQIGLIINSFCQHCRIFETCLR